jgi:hypothetical protein
MAAVRRRLLSISVATLDRSPQGCGIDTRSPKSSPTVITQAQEFVVGVPPWCRMVAPRPGVGRLCDHL